MMSGVVDLRSRTLTYRPFCRVHTLEVEGNDDRDDLIDAVIEFFAERSYSGQYVLGGKWHPISDLDRVATRQMADKVAKHGMATNMLLYARHYVHNFVFKPVG